ncbi:MAG TPA: SDR family NAD(P)-dependent oxidoreductase [Ktedonobacterales bacterium]|nr:SDR family NAD(P)-dependent oxidoreductase [Ktedonobacterales bacterium]
MQTLTQLLSLQGRRVLITGAAAGIGHAMALRFAEAGADLDLVDRDTAGLTRLADDLANGLRQVRTHVVDLTNRAAILALWEGMGAETPDTLINNAGSYPMRDYEEVDPHFLEKTLRVNLESALWMAQGFIAGRKRKGGVIVNVSSVEALIPLRDDLIPYSVAKAGILALTRGLAHAYGRDGFRVNVLVPGAIRTPGTDRLRGTAIRQLDVDMIKTGIQFGSRLSLGRWGKADEVARVALFLASDLASYVHGAMIPVDGGFLAS